MNLKSQWLKKLWNKNRRTSLRGPRSLAGRRQAPVEVLEAKQLLVGDIAGTLLHDTNGNAVKDPGEEGLVNWTVFLDLNNNASLDAGEPSQQTIAGGDYLFLNLADGSYSVREVLPTGWAPSPGTSAVQTATVTDGNEFKANFFNVIAEVGDITGTVWRDFNGDGVRATDPTTGAFTDTALAGWTIYLDTNNNRTLDAGEVTTLTDANGNYSFLGVASGSQYVAEVLQTPYEASRGFDSQVHVTLATGGVKVVDFANLTPEASDVSGTVFNDIDGNGARGATEPGLAGWQVFVDKNEDGLLTPGELVTTSAADGSYTLVGVPRGRQMITQVPDAHYRTNSPAGGAFTIDVLNGVMLTGYDFANEERIGNLSGTLWNDFNGDGVRALTDVALSGWTVFLDANLNGVADPTEATQTTDANGQYTFVGLPEGTVTVAEVVPTGWEVAPGFSASVNASISTGLTTTADFANLQPVPSTINGAIYNDMNADGHRATNPTTGAFTEPGLSGWQVFVDLNNDGTLTAGEPVATSDADGNYSLTGVPHGTRKIVEVPNPNFATTAPAGGSYTINVLNGVTIGGYDFGNQERSDATIRGAVYVDSNHNGARDAGERGLSGVTVYLDLNDDGHLDTGEPSLVTSADLYYTPGTDEAGTYSFTHLAGGTYKIREIVPVELSSTPVSEAEHLVTIGGAEAKTIDAGNVFRPNEIHGVKFDDANGNHVRDAGEAGIGGVTIYIDLNRNNVLDASEPTTVTAADGSYAFTNLAPDAYVLREVGQTGYEQTYPTTTDGTLLPSGTSHPASGNVTPTSISGSLASGATLRQTVSLTLPGTGGVTNLADVFLLFDDTGSFTANSPIVRGAFPQIISTLTTALPGIDFGFGVGRFEEYANFAGEYASGRPFILNHPVVAASTPGFATAIQAALDRTAPGYGGDQPETDIEALFQLVTGLGFDGNNNGTFSDSGAAGLVSTQLNPGSSGDVPAFSSYTVDASGSALPAAGNIGGGGFRAGALPIILLATDTGFAYQPKGETSITGVNGVTIPVADIVHTTRTTTPFNYGAGIQETITGLNALGALVIGLGTNADLVSDPRADMAALARLTGAVNNSTSTIANGTATPIAPGDPFYFQISSGFGTSVADGITNAIQNAVTNIAVNMTVKASDPRVHIINHTGTVTNVGAGQTATFDVEFTGDGRPHRFDLQFIREGTNVVLGSIPVELGTPIPGNGYEFEDLLEGQIDQNVNFGNHSLAAVVPNVAPSFVAGANESVLEDAGAQTVTAWATSISAGPASESSQTVDFVVTNDNASLFSVAPAIAADGTLTYTPAANANGSATITVSLHDNGGTASGGVDTSASQTFTITVTPVNDAPVANNESYSTTTGSTLTVAASGVLTNDTDVDGDKLTASVVTAPLHGTLTLNPDGSFTYQPDAGFLGSDGFTYKANDGLLDSNVASVSLTVTSTTIYQQTPSASGRLVYSSWLAPDGFDGDIFVYDNFAVASDFSIASIDWTGTAAPNVAAGNTAFSIAIYDSLPGGSQPHITALPNMDPNGSLVTYRLAAGDFTVTPGANGLFNYHFQLPTAFTAAKGTYWIQIEGFDGGWQWAASSTGDSRDFKYFVGGPYFLRGGEDVAFTLNGAASVVNQAPVSSNGSLTTDEDIAATGTLSATDVDSATLTYSLVDMTTAHGTVTITDAATGAFSYTPDANYNGSASFTFKANDGALDSNVSTVTITVNAVNDAPIATDGSVTTNEDTAATGTLSATDIDSATLTFSLVDTTTAHGTVTITDTATGAFSYTPDKNYNGSARFTFEANDGALDSNVSTVTITVNAVNDAPIATDGSVITNEDTAATGTLSATDIDSATLTYSLVDTATAHGTVTITDAATGAFSYTPDKNFNGSASFTFKANDGALDSNISTVTLTINAVNDAPITTDGSVTTDEDTATTGTLSATDIDSATLTFSLVDTTTAHGIVTITNAATGAFSYTPDANYNGSASFTFKANDGALDSNISTVTITVNAVNDAPIATDGSVTTNEDTAATGTLSATDIDSATLTYSLVDTTTAHGTVTITDAATGAFSYTPDKNFNGSASFTFKANDGTLDSNISTVTITVNAVNDAPIATDGSVTVSENGSTTGTLSASDVDGNSLTYRLLSTANAHGTVTLTNAATGAFSYAPDKNFSGAASFTFVANDGSLDSNIGTVTINVTSLATRELVYTATGSTVLTVTVASGKLRVKLGNVVQPDVDPATVRSISLNGGSGRDSINLTGLSALLYSHVTGVTVNGGDGNDTLIGSFGADSIDGGNGNDSVSGGDGADTLLGGVGNDTMFGGSGDDVIDAGLGNDVASGDAGNDDIHGSAGNDVLVGGAGNDCLHGDDGNDTLSGGIDDDTIHGGAGNDSADGGAGNDVLLGEDGKDTLLGGIGSDILSGGLGDDSLNGSGSGTAALDGNDTLLGGAGNDVLKGGFGNDVLSGEDGNDTLIGESGIDSLFGGLGNDSLSTGESNSTDGLFNDLVFLTHFAELLAACP